MPVEPIDPAAATAVVEAALPLRTERLVLRRLSPDDLDAYRAYQSDPDTVRYLWRPMLTHEQMRSRLSERPAFTADGGSCTMAIEHDGMLVGETVVKLVHPGWRQVAIGWMLAPDHRGRGLATEAAGVTLDLAWAIGAHRVVAILAHENQASARVAERLGMRREAVMLEDGVNPATGAWGSSETWARLEHERGRSCSSPTLSSAGSPG